jgi:hypothetical protein
MTKLPSLGAPRKSHMTRTLTMVGNVYMHSSVSQECAIQQQRPVKEDFRVRAAVTMLSATMVLHVDHQAFGHLIPSAYPWWM